MLSSSHFFPRLRSPRRLYAGLLLVLGAALLLGACSTTAGTSGTSGTPGNGQPYPATATSSNSSGGGNPTATPGGSNPTATPGGSNPTATPAPSAPSSFVWTAASSNITSNWTIIDNANTNGYPSAILLVTPRYEPNDVYDDHPIGVWYYAGKWTIFHQDHSAMIPGASFNVRVFSASAAVFTWVADSSSIQNNWTNISISLTPGGAADELVVTPIYNPHNIYDNHPIGVWWTGSNWTIFNQDKVAMPVNAAFNVIAVAGGGNNVFLQTATASNVSYDYTVISGNSATDYQSGAILECTPVYNPNNVYDDHNIGVYYNDPHWAVYNQDQAAMPVNASFDCMIGQVIS
jgi:hypothetical protein